MRRADFRRHVAPLVPSAQFSTEDGMGTKLHPAYIDVIVPTEDVPKLEAACAGIGLKAAKIGVVCYYGRSLRRVALA